MTREPNPARDEGERRRMSRWRRDYPVDDFNVTLPLEMSSPPRFKIKDSRAIFWPLILYNGVSEIIKSFQ